MKRCEFGLISAPIEIQPRAIVLTAGEAGAKIAAIKANKRTNERERTA